MSDDKKLEELQELGAKFLETAPKNVEEKRFKAPVSPREKALSIQEKRAKFVQVLSRGIVNDRLKLADRVAEGYKGFWVRDRPEDIDRVKALGGVIVEQDSMPEKGLHGTGDNRVKIGDVILMQINAEDYSVIQDIKSEWTRNRLTAGRRLYKENAARGGVPIIDESN